MQFFKYLIVGCINTFVGLGFTFILLWLNVSIYYANLAGYLLGFIVSYTLNSRFTFSKQYSKANFIKFIIAQFIAYLVNLFFVYITLLVFPGSVYYAQLSGNIAYTITGFIINKYWALK